MDEGILDNERGRVAPTESNAKVRSSGVVFSPIAFLAVLAVVALLGISSVKAWQFVSGGNAVSATNPPSDVSTRAETPFSGIDWQIPLATNVFDQEDPDGLANIEDNVAAALLGSYSGLADAGLYTPEGGKKIAEDIASSLRARVTYRLFSPEEIKTDADTSYERMLQYRDDMRIALEPLLSNPGYELALFASYIESRDPTYTEKLREAAQNYKKSLENAGALTVPVDAAHSHTGVLNALSEFGATIDAMARFADDAFASAALLQTYNASEARLLTSFNDLASYQRNKQL